MTLAFDSGASAPQQPPSPHSRAPPCARTTALARSKASLFPWPAARPAAGAGKPVGRPAGDPDSMEIRCRMFNARSAVWPRMAGPGLAVSDVGTVTRPDGSLQVTYELRPLYTYAGDTAPGQANGQGAAGGRWSVVAVALTGTGPSRSTTTTSGRGTA